MTTFCRVLLIFGIYVAVCCAQSVEDDVFHFTNPSQGNAVWILDESSLPWTGGYQFLRSISGMPTTLLSVVDSSTGVTLGQCVAPQDATGNFSKRWERFSWELTASGLDCTFEHGAAIRVEFDRTQNPRTFSIRIQSITGPACLRDVVVQTEQATGCPPHLSRNSFTANALNCSCPFLDAANEDSEIENEDVDMLANTPQFPLFKGIDPSVLGSANPPTLPPSPCANHECHNNGTCLVSQEGAATCLCRNGFTGDRCELDVCSSVPCQNGGVCRSNNGIAYCECPPAFTGLLCESAHTDESVAPICRPECSNGQCVFKDGQAQCECRQGFTGANCNVLDVCLGDAACSMFGPLAKCVLDDNMDKMSSLTLINGTYDCLCPHPIHGQFVDCMQLHAPSATSVQPTEQVVINNVTPSFPVLEISKLPTGAPVTFTATSTTLMVTQPTVTVSPTHQVPSEPFVGFTVTRAPLRPLDIGSTTLPPPFNQHIITAGEPTWSSQQPHQPSEVPTQTTFIFPQTPETTTFAPTTGTQQPVHKFVSPSVPDENEEEEEEETTEETEETFPTPSTMQVATNGQFTTETAFVTSTIPSTTTDMEETDEDEDMTEEVTDSSTQPSTTVFVQPTTTFTTEAPTTTMEEEEEMTTDQVEDIESEEIATTTTQTSLPFWMTTTNKQVVPDSPTPMVIMPHPQPDEKMETSTEGVVDEESDEERTTESNEEVVTKNAEATTPSDITHHHTSSGKQSSAAASWIIAIIALIVLGLLLLATSLFILRYIRQSRKLHGKYNPAREEHNLSAAYAMPMSHIAKEERLI
ncbi:Abnormal pharyngeal pumping eat-20 [Caenorhabditis elegans]|uniref:Isoform a of Abnormal pharyngeal pumping eat-20 n=1 Tax=Caenorhabditis elegans TaxID=6239 RepID=Q9NL29-2|nr:Abnormal pharyngeal pumping eat-20 [Caenorhabditis elegans]BAA92157.1 EAT-20A [Caenorhabditis elegans]CAA15516.1 Abnormal pharyngeal pumping eat-20 [Caenorhabditis elegans]|eukprot:NP_001024740.1 Abnormal pharyngeal pumping eat-20 [Caenorhabditis elegans]